MAKYPLTRMQMYWSNLKYDCYHGFFIIKKVKRWFKHRNEVRGSCPFCGQLKYINKVKIGSFSQTPCEGCGRVLFT